MAMEEDAFTDISGRAITLDCHDHSSFCREYVVSSPKVSLWKVLCYTSAVWLVAYAVFFFTQNTAVLTTAILVTLLGMMLHIHLVKVDHESLLVIGSLGIQVSYGYASGRKTSSFIEMGKIKDIVINEAIYMEEVDRLVSWCSGNNLEFNAQKTVEMIMDFRKHQIVYYLCVLLNDPSDPNAVSGVVPLFQSSKPRLDCLVKVYKSCQEILSKCS